MLNDGAIQPLYDRRMLREYDAVLRRPRFHLTAEIVDAIMDNVRLHGELITANSLSLTLPDTTDLPFLEVAIAGTAQYLVTGNTKDYIPVQGTHTMKVIPPREFLDQCV
jgi:predicted nucleic acid-binding protein